MCQVLSTATTALRLAACCAPTAAMKAAGVRFDMTALPLEGAARAGSSPPEWTWAPQGIPARFRLS
jgi:hypothetical protein